MSLRLLNGDRVFGAAIVSKLNERVKCRPHIDARLIYKSELGKDVRVAKLENWNSEKIFEPLNRQYFAEPYYLKITNLSDFSCYEVKIKATIHNFFGKSTNNKIEYRIPKLSGNETVYINVLKEIMLKEQIDTEFMVTDYNAKKKSKFDVGCFAYSKLINTSDLIKEIENCKYDMKNIVCVYQKIKPVINDKDLYKFKKMNLSFSSERFEPLVYKFVGKSTRDNTEKIGELFWKNKKRMKNLIFK